MPRPELTERTCWTCFYQDLHKEQVEIFGMCDYFKAIGKQPKEIPAHVVDSGCKFWKEKQGALFG